MREENYSLGTECTRRYAIKAALQVASERPRGFAALFFQRSAALTDPSVRKPSF